MSRVGNSPVKLPNNVEFTEASGVVSVKGPLGSLQMNVVDNLKITKKDDNLFVEKLKKNNVTNAMSGTCRAILFNIVKGVSEGFEKKLNLVGVGYRAQLQGDSLNLSLGFSHPVVYKLPDGIKAETPSQTEILIKGIDKQKVGQVSAEIRAFRPPEPYKGKGVRYSDERVIMKETKKK